MVLWCSTALGTVAAGATSDESPPPSPYLRPEFARLIEAVTFHVSFDRGSMQPDMAEGPQYAPTLAGSNDKSSPGPQFAPGLIGKALVLGTGRASYPLAGNVRLQQRGAVAVWVRPEHWQRPEDRNVVFVMTTKATFYLQRQGPLAVIDGKQRRHEGIQYLVRDETLSRLNSISDSEPWPNDRWRLIVANWSWPGFAVSIDGGPFQGKGLTQPPDPECFGNLVLGDAGGEPRGLLDEFFAFRRPLSEEEARLLWRLNGNSEFGSRNSESGDRKP